MVVVLVHDRQSVGVVAVDAYAAPVPAGSVVPAAPVVGGVRVVAVPAGDQRCRRAPVVGPHAQPVVVVHEVAVDVVVPAARPKDLRVGLDRLRVRVLVGDDDHLRSVGERLVADDSVGARLGVDLLDVDVVVGPGFGNHGAGWRARVRSRAIVGCVSVPVGAAPQQAEPSRQERRAPPLPCTIVRHICSLHCGCRPFKTWIPRRSLWCAPTATGASPLCRLGNRRERLATAGWCCSATGGPPVRGLCNSCVRRRRASQLDQFRAAVEPMANNSSHPRNTAVERCVAR